MTIWLRNISQCLRVTLGIGSMGVLLAITGLLAGWALYGQAQALSAHAATIAAAQPIDSAQLMADAASAKSLFAWVAGITVVGCLYGALAAYFIRGSIKAPIEDTVQAVIRISKGDLVTKIESPGKDEFAWLRYELDSMRKKLGKTVLEVRSSVDTVSSASEEIARGNTDLSARTESQASALQQTTSTMEQLTDAVRSNARNATEASTLVNGSSEVATRGAKIMKDVVDRMGEINVSASRIGEIIGVIDGIAFQTNILALNAAVEAARAGEHGRGFAVVASEVRGLAQRSATAAREIKSLIDASTQRVDAGSKLVDEAGVVMRDILSSVTKVSNLVNDIAQAGQAQSDGIGEVHKAIGQIDDVTQQNAALVEQVAAAAQSLKGQSDRLSEAMSGFRVTA